MTNNNFINSTSLNTLIQIQSLNKSINLQFPLNLNLIYLIQSINSLFELNNIEECELKLTLNNDKQIIYKLVDPENHDGWLTQILPGIFIEHEHPHSPYTKIENINNIKEIRDIRNQNINSILELIYNQSYKLEINDLLIHFQFDIIISDTKNILLLDQNGNYLNKLSFQCINCNNNQYTLNCCDSYNNKSLSFIQEEEIYPIINQFQLYLKKSYLKLNDCCDWKEFDGENCVFCTPDFL